MSGLRRSMERRVPGLDKVHDAIDPLGVVEKIEGGVSDEWSKMTDVPKPPEPEPMPIPDEAMSQKAKQRKAESRRRRSGRQSTIMSQGLGG